MDLNNDDDCKPTWFDRLIDWDNWDIHMWIWCIGILIILWNLGRKIGEIIATIF